MNENSEQIKSRSITYVVFIFTLTVVALSIVSLVFPALYLSSFETTESQINSFELGAWAIPFFSINVSILVFALIAYKKIFPSKIYSFFNLILKFEVSRKTAIIVFSVMIGIYIIVTAGELRLQEIDVWKDWQILEPIIEEFPDGGEDKPALKIQYVKNFLLFSSQQIFQNVKVIPFIGSIALVFFTYLLTVQITNKRFSGLIAMAILLQSHTFLRYDTTATYSNFWTLFYLVSLYLVYKKWPFSPLAYMSSIFSKALTITYLPMTLFFIYRSNVVTKTKVILTALYLGIFSAIIGTVVFAENYGFGKTLTLLEFQDFLEGFTTWAFQLRIDGLLLIFLLPLTIGLFLKSRQGFREADSILIMIAGVILSVPLLAGFTEFNIQPYRWIPLIVFFAIGVGCMFTKISVNRSVK